MITPLLIAVKLVLLHTVDGRETLVNPQQVASMSARKVGEENKLLVGGVECAIGLTNGKIISVVEPCDEVKLLLEAAR